MAYSWWGFPHFKTSKAPASSTFMSAFTSELAHTPRVHLHDIIVAASCATDDSSTLFKHSQLSQSRGTGATRGLGTTPAQENQSRAQGQYLAAVPSPVWSPVCSGNLVCVSSSLSPALLLCLLSALFFVVVRPLVGNLVCTSSCTVFALEFHCAVLLSCRVKHAFWR